MKNLLNQGIIIRFLFLLMLLFGYDSYSQRNIGFEPSYIEIVIPDYAILTPEKDSQINDRFKEYLYSYNLSLITEDSNISKMMQNKYVYDRIRAESDAILKKSNEYDFIKLCLTSMFPELIFEKMDQYCGYYYENEFDYPYLIFFTNESSKISNEINVDFSLSFEKFHLGKKNDSLFTSIKIVDKEGNDYIINHQDKLSFERHQDLEDDLFRFFGNITPEVSSFICSRDKNLVENQNIKLKQRNYVINNFVFDSKIPESLSNKLKAEEPALKCYSYKDGLLNNEETIFKGYFYRIFNDSTGQHFLRDRDEYKQSFSSDGTDYLSIDSVGLMIVGLKYEGIWYYSITSNGVSFLRKSYKRENVDLTKYQEGMISILNGHDNNFFIGETLEMNSNYLEELYYIKNKDNDGIPKIVHNYKRRKRQK